MYKKRKSSAVRSGGPVVADDLDAIRERNAREKWQQCRAAGGGSACRHCAAAAAVYTVLKP